MKIKINEEQYKKLVKSLTEDQPLSGQTDSDKNIEFANKKDMVKSIVNDPSMMKAFYKQPSLWNILMSKLKGKKAKGTGVIPAEDIAKKYGLYNLSKNMYNMVKNFNFNKSVTFTLLSDTVTFPSENPPVVYEANKKYSAIVSEPKLGQKNIVLIDKNTKVKIIIKDKNTSEMSRNTFNVVFSKLVPDGQGQLVNDYVKAIIMIDSRKDSGFYNYKR
jgi:hypothetical protein